eukprot:CAMPEP_0113540096 /NCGR_PEP_ID=MMETSP0015_2-20120614/8294_1 /TAXON_ID=2838 /ORGANISM="Odontella" /LENGTH=621 /DNA_ID=CAMNT_0000439869 /DNA_START=75 /DNA_END=1941 /DNA_ORIENTATION=+ /assembly_acc=CAM_ASM_000160
MSGWHRLSATVDDDGDETNSGGSGSTGGVEMRSGSSVGSGGFVVVQDEAARPADAPAESLRAGEAIGDQDDDDDDEFGGRNLGRLASRLTADSGDEPPSEALAGGSLTGSVRSLGGEDSLDNARLRAAAASIPGIMASRDEGDGFLAERTGLFDDEDDGECGGMDEDEFGNEHHEEDEEGQEMVALGSSKHSARAFGGKMSEWAAEGQRRVRSVEVDQRMRRLTAVAAIGGFLFGYDTGVISGAMLPIKRTFDLSPSQEEAVVSSTILAAFVFSLIGGSINHTFGRRKSALFAAAVFSVGSVVLAAAWDYNSLLAGRVIVGVGIGVASLTTPVYIAEVAKPSMRGTLVTVNALLVCVGQFVAGMCDGFFDEIAARSGGWRYMLGLACVPSLGMFSGFLELPESPRWLLTKGRSGEALDILRSIRDTDHGASEELVEIMDALPSATAMTDSGHVSLSSAESGSLGGGVTGGRGRSARSREKHFCRRVWDMLSDPPTRRALRLGCGIMALQQFSGINTVMYYAASIYEMSEFDEITSIWLSGFTALAQVIGIALSIFLVERVGRRALVLTSLFMVTLSLFGLGRLFSLREYRRYLCPRPMVYAEASPRLFGAESLAIATTAPG